MLAMVMVMLMMAKMIIDGSFSFLFSVNSYFCLLTRPECVQQEHLLESAGKAITIYSIQVNQCFTIMNITISCEPVSIY
jgi:hypothetical protein